MTGKLTADAGLVAASNSALIGRSRSVGRGSDRQERFEELIDRFHHTGYAIHKHMVPVIVSFLAGMLAGEGRLEEIKVNLDLERWFRLPKSHERRIQGDRHAGVRIVLEGPKSHHALDAHVFHPEPFIVEDLPPYRTAQERLCQKQALDRRKITRKARSTKKRPSLLADLKWVFGKRRSLGSVAGHSLTSAQATFVAVCECPRPSAAYALFYSFAFLEKSS
jgi:hypothetical protein